MKLNRRIQNYRNKKAKALEDTEKTPMNTQNIKYRTQRDLLVWFYRKELKYSYRNIAKIFTDNNIEMSNEQIRLICKKFGEKTTENDQNDEKEGEMTGD